MAAFWLQIAAEGIFCCYNNSSNGSLVLCAAEMWGFVGMSVHNDVCGSVTLWKLYGASNNLVQELRLDDARFHTTPCALKLVRSVAIFSFILLLLLL